MNDPNNATPPEEEDKESSGDGHEDGTTFVRAPPACVMSHPQQRRNSPRAAGVLPFTVLNGRIYFLLGRESPRMNFAHSGTWCDFGGGVTGRRQGIVTAAQELQQETYGALLNRDVGAMVKYIRDNVYMCVESDIGNKIPYHMYVVRIFPLPDNDVATTFEWRLRVARKHRCSGNTCTSPERARLLRQQPESFQQNGKVRKCWLEKDELRWVSALDMETKSHHLRYRPEFINSIKKYDIINRLRILLFS